MTLLLMQPCSLFFCPVFRDNQRVFTESQGDYLMETIANINSAINNFVWGIPAMVCILGIGLYLSIITRFIQIRKFGKAMKETFGKIFSKDATAEGAISPFQALCTALAATVGTGNIAGVAGAIAIGGPGAVFWMWISAILGMCTKFSEVTLAVHFREIDDTGTYVGGPMYYIRNGLGRNWKWLGWIFALFGILAVFGTGNATQVNTITTSIDTALTSFNIMGESGISMLNLIVGIILAVLIAFILIGGVQRIGAVTEKLVPFMAVFYIVLGIGVIVINFRYVPGAIASIFEGAFSPSGVTGGVVGSMFLSVQKGIARGIFSNEAGLGTGSMAHASADVNHPVKQGFFGIFEVFVDTIVICTMTALIILCGRAQFEYGQPAGAEITIQGFINTYGSWVSVFTAVAMCCFAFSTILGWGLYGTRCAEFIFGSKAQKPFLVLYALVAILGATMDLGIIWEVAETFNGLMAIPNLIGVFLLSGTVVKLIKNYFSDDEYISYYDQKQLNK